MVETARKARRHDGVLIRCPERFVNLTYIPHCQFLFLFGPDSPCGGDVQ